MILSDLDIMRAQLDDDIITPFDVEQLQPASYDLLLGPGFKRMNRDERAIDPVRRPMPADMYEEIFCDFLFLRSQQFLLVSTSESVRIPTDLVGRVEGKSSLARLGLMVHVTAGYIDPGFNGQITLEVVNLGPRDIKLTVGMRIAQLTLAELTCECDVPYGHPDLGSKYQDQAGATGSRGVEIGLTGPAPVDESSRALNEVFNG